MNNPAVSSFAKSRQIFVNLPVADLQASIAFFTRLGFGFNPKFTDETASCIIIGDNIFAMLLTREKFAGFTPLPVSDARAATEVLIAIALESRDAVDAMVREAVAAGGSTYNEPQDHGFMYGHGFQDLRRPHLGAAAPDGGVWEHGITYRKVTSDIEAIWRIESARVVAGIARLTRDLGLAEDFAQDALLTALQRWPGTGIPDNPGAWLMTAARRRALDHLRHKTMAAPSHVELARELDARHALAEAAITEQVDAALDDDIGDDMLRLIFMSFPIMISD